MNLIMNKRSRMIILTLLLMACCMLWTGKKVQAAVENGYTYDVTNNKASITKYSGTATTITVPSKLGGYDVTAIGYRAFAETKVVSVVIPSGITTFGDGVFCDCTYLKSVTLPETITKIPDSTFLGCTKLNNVTVPSGVTSIMPYAFGECKSLTAISLPDSLISIYHDAFYQCTALKTITLGANVSAISSTAFSYCTALEEYKISSSNAFFAVENGVLFSANKTTLILYPAAKRDVAYYVPNSVTSINEYAFSDVAVTKKVYIPETVTTISTDAFDNAGSQLVICAPAGSTAETYAKENNITYNNDTYVPITSLEITNGKDVTITLDKKTYQINTKITPSDASDSTLTYTSSDTAVATVNNSGLITLKSTGFSLITVSCGDSVEKGYVFLNVNPAPKISMSSSSISLKLSTSSYVYTGGYKKPAVSVYNGKTKVATTNYKVSYASNKAIGTATVTVTGINNYTGTRKITFKILPPKISKVKLTGKKKSVYVKWTRVSSATGYQVYYSLKKSSGYKLAKTIGSNKTLKYTIKKLGKKKKYFVKVRAYKKVGSKVYYGSYSALKVVKTK